MVLAATAMPVALPDAASAHPLGDPETADISLSAVDTVRIRWRAGMVDDYTYLAHAIGALPDDRETLDGALTPQVGDAFLVQRAPQLAPYVLEHISVTANGEACPGRLVSVEGLAANGLIADFTCRDAVREVSITMTMLTDLSELYTTIATGPDGAVQAYRGAETTRDWTFAGATVPALAEGAAPSGGDAAAPAPSVEGVAGMAAIGAVALLGAGLVIALAQRRRRAHDPALVASDRAPTPPAS